jgi:epoxyqueuosine reductase
MSLLRKELGEYIVNLGLTHWGIADISGLHPLAESYPRALSLGLAYQAPFQKYDESTYYALTLDVKAAFDPKFDAMVSFLSERGISHYVPPAKLKDPDRYIPEFPHRLAAVRAGLGWVGKSSMLITPGHGPRVRLATILLPGELEADVPLAESGCGDCTACFEACPNDALRNTAWTEAVSRNDQISPDDCSKKREEYIPVLGRKHACGLCLLKCPVGAGGIKNRIS